jgi:hypothetical protein
MEHTMISPNRASGFLEPFLKILIVVFVLHFIYDWFITDEEEDDTITVTFRCNQVLTMQNQYPDFVIQQCKQMKIR